MMQRQTTRSTSEQGRALQDEEGGQRDDDIGHAGDDDQHAVDGAQHQAHGQHERHDEKRVFLAGAVHHRGGGDAGQRHHGADGKIDAAGNDDNRLGGHGKGVRQHRAHQRAEIAAAIAWLDELGDHEQDHEQDNQAGDPALAAEKAAQGVTTGLERTSARMPTSSLAPRGKP
jgi:hypothetical protein